MFLTPEEIAVLTGRKVRSKQIEALRLMGIAFFVNAVGKPIVAKAVIEGRPGSAPPVKLREPWRPNVLLQGAIGGAKTN
jgi:hypothetical protein